MKRRIAFFAHFDPDGIVDEYVIRYLASLLDAGLEAVYFATDSDLCRGELEKLPRKVVAVNGTRHGEYDFGSWKRCLARFISSEGRGGIGGVDELVLCNDSCYGPLFPLNSMFCTMASRPCDYWGVARVEYDGGYYPSFFFVVRNPVMQDAAFLGFLQSVGPFSGKREYCLRYEVGLNRLLERLGYRGACYLERYAHLCHSSFLALCPEVVREGMPFIRCMTARVNPGGIAHLGSRIKEICGHCGYPDELIVSHLRRVAPGFERCWRYRYGDVDRKILGIIRVRRKPKPEKDRVRLKVWIFGIPVFYGIFQMKYDPESGYAEGGADG